MERRNFLKTMGVGALSMAICNDMPAADISAKKLPAIGIITGLIGGQWLKDNPRVALKRIAEVGYKELEFGGDFGLGMNAAELTKYLKSLGMKPLIGSTSMASMNDEARLKAEIKRCQELGQKFIACYWPWTTDGQGSKIDDWKRVADNLNKGGAICKKEGVTLIYHNHDIEFRITEGEMPFDVMMSRLDPALVGIELDLYWVAKGGQSAEEYIKKYPGRYPVFHVKDMTNTPEKDFACVGSGCIDFASIFKLNSTAGVKHFMVEHDRPEDSEACITSSAKYLLALRF